MPRSRSARCTPVHRVSALCPILDETKVIIAGSKLLPLLVTPAPGRGAGVRLSQPSNLSK